MSAGVPAAIDNTRGERAGTGRPSWLLGIVGVAWFLVLLDDTAVAVALPSVGRDLGMGLTGLEWVVNIYTLVFAVLTLAAGAGTDRYGHRPVFLAGLSVFTASSVVAAVSANGAMLVAMWAVQGGGAALIGPAALAMLLACMSPLAEPASRSVPRSRSVGAGDRDAEANWWWRWTASGYASAASGDRHPLRNLLITTREAANSARRAAPSRRYRGARSSGRRGWPR